MLTEQERKWLKQRDRNLFSFGLYLAFTPGMSPALIDYRDAAEFEARVAEKLTLKEPCPLPEHADLDDCPYFIEDEESAFSCRWCSLKRARIAVEEEMDNE
jgi:hypothetical protein